jgi:hypothetical protein
LKNIVPNSSDRYTRDLRRYNLALKMLQLAARPSTVRAWTGLSHQRVRSILRSQGYHRSERVPGIRRGPPLTDLASLLTNPNLRSELTAIAGLCRVLGLIPTERLSNARARLPSVAAGERLCHVIQVFREIVPHARVTLEEVILVIFALAEGDVWSLDHCAGCRAVILVDRLKLARRVCADCRREAAAPSTGAPAAVDGSLPEDRVESPGIQQSLF